MSQYIYKNTDDTIRIAIIDRDTSFGKEWDFDVFDKATRSVSTESQTSGDLFRTKAEAKAAVITRFGQVKSINPKVTVTNGWENWQ